MLAVTTRNKLKSARFIVPMLIARKKVREQLRHARGLIRSADAMASPTELYTLTLWANKQSMFNFMSSDAHRDMMWMFAKWTEEFWSMRWLPGECEQGDWNGMHFARRDDKAIERRPQTPIPDIAKGPRPGAGPIDPSRCPVTAVMARVVVRDPQSLSRLMQTWRRLHHDPQQARLLRWMTGAVGFNQYLLITLWRNDDASASEWIANELRASWLMVWQPGDYEIGHWDGLRLRQLASAARRAQSSLTHMA